MTTHSSILASKSHGRGALWATVHEVIQESDMRFITQTTYLDHSKFLHYTKEITTLYVGIYREIGFQHFWLLQEAWWLGHAAKVYSVL